LGESGLMARGAAIIDVTIRLWFDAWSGNATKQFGAKCSRRLRL
jgi:hypothetical protein